MAKKKKKNKISTLVVCAVVILIVALAVWVGMKEGEKIQNSNSNNVAPSSSSNNATTKPTVLPSGVVTPTPTPEVVETPKTVDTSKMSNEEKIEYAKQIAKKTWEEAEMDIPVTYAYETVLSDGRYMIRLENNATAVDYCYVNINTGTGELETYK